MCVCVCVCVCVGGCVRKRQNLMSKHSSLQSMAVLGKIFRVHAKFFWRDWRAHANFGVNKVSNPPHAAFRPYISILLAYKRLTHPFQRLSEKSVNRYIRVSI